MADPINKEWAATLRTGRADPSTIPPGGAKGQALIKLSDFDFDVGFEDPALLSPDNDSAYLQPVVAGSGIGGGGFAKHIMLAGAAAGDFVATGIKVGDELNEVIYYVGAGTAVTNVVDLTAEFSITDSDKINNTNGTPTTGGALIVRWTKLTV